MNVFFILCIIETGDVMFDKLVKEVFHTSNYKIEKLNLGYTNHNYILLVFNKKYVVRIPSHESSTYINRIHEKEVEELTSDLHFPTIYFDSKTGIKISEYIENLYEYKDCPYPDKIERCARLMKKLHSLPCVDFSFDPIENLLLYKNKVKNPIHDLSKYEKIAMEVKTFHNTPVLCHNDFVSGNIMYGKNRDYLIDYEYAGRNDPLFDVMSFLSENQIFDKELRERFYHEYFKEMNDTIYHELHIWEVFQNVLWCYWAMMMYESRKEDIYKTISQDKYNALIQNEDSLNQAEIKKGLSPFYHTIEIHDEVVSTNTLLKEKANKLKEGYVLVSDTQSGGRGRNGKTFYSPKQNGIYLSFLIKPKLHLQDALKISACVSVAVHKAIHKLYNIETSIKWINDIYLKDYKIAGILCESSLKVNSSELEYMVIGIGLNVHEDRFPKELKYIATSIENHTIIKHSRNTIIKEILNQFYYYYENFEIIHFMDIYRKYSYIIGKEITVIANNTSYQANVLTINDNGALVIQKDNTIETLTSAEISIHTKKTK